MKAIAVNGSPRKGWNTDMLLQQALKGAADAGAETELIQLSDLKFSGCRSCFACKRAGAETGRCMWKDDLQPVFDKMLAADAVFMGSPIYLGNVSGMMYCLASRDPCGEPQSPDIRAATLHRRAGGLLLL